MGTVKTPFFKKGWAFLDLILRNTGHFIYKDNSTIDGAGIPVCKMNRHTHKFGYKEAKHRYPKSIRRQS